MGARRHGMSKTRTHAIWSGMLTRCRNTKRHDYKRYGAVGITVCERWLSFDNFLADMGEAAPGLSIDRIDGTGNYEPSNCRWATKLEQARNTKAVRWVVYRGERMTIVEASKLSGIEYATLHWRVRTGWDDADLFRPSRGYGEGHTGWRR